MRRFSPTAKLLNVAPFPQIKSSRDLAKISDFSKVLNRINIDSHYLANLSNHWNHQVYVVGWNPTVNDFNLFLKTISEYKSKKGAKREKRSLELGKQVFESCKIRTCPNDSTFIYFLEILIRNATHCGNEIEIFERNVLFHFIKIRIDLK